MNQAIHDIKAGQLVIMTHGIHTEAEDHYPIRAIKDFEVYEQLKLFVQETGKSESLYTDDFIDWLIEKGFAEHLPNSSVQYPELGNYKFSEKF